MDTRLLRLIRRLVQAEIDQAVGLPGAGLARSKVLGELAAALRPFPRLRRSGELAELLARRARSVAPAAASSRSRK